MTTEVLVSAWTHQLRADPKVFCVLRTRGPIAERLMALTGGVLYQVEGDELMHSAASREDFDAEWKPIHLEGDQ